MLRDNPVGSSHQCLENPRPAGAELSLTEDVTSPFQAEPRHPERSITFDILVGLPQNLNSLTPSHSASSRNVDQTSEARFELFAALF